VFDRGFASLNDWLDYSTFSTPVFEGLWLETYLLTEKKSIVTSFHLVYFVVVIYRLVAYNRATTSCRYDSGIIDAVCSYFVNTLHTLGSSVTLGPGWRCRDWADIEQARPCNCGVSKGCADSPRDYGATDASGDTPEQPRVGADGREC